MAAAPPPAVVASNSSAAAGSTASSSSNSSSNGSSSNGFGMVQHQHTITQTTLLDFQHHVMHMLEDRDDVVLDWCANMVNMSKRLHLPSGNDLFSDFHEPDPDYVVPDSTLRHGIPRPFVAAPGDYSILAKDIVLTAHRVGQAQHSIVVFAETSGQSFKKDVAEVYAAFLRYYKIKLAIFGVATTKSLTLGASRELNGQADFEIDIHNLEDSSLRVVEHDFVPPVIKKLPVNVHAAFLKAQQCRRPLALHRKHNPFTPYVLSGQDPKDKVSRYMGLKEGDLIVYERPGTASSGWDHKYRHVRDRTAAHMGATGPSSGDNEGGGVDVPTSSSAHSGSATNAHALNRQSKATTAASAVASSSMEEDE